MRKVITTNHKTIKVFGFKICDIWEDYIAREVGDFSPFEDYDIIQEENDEKRD